MSQERKTGIVVWINSGTGMIRVPELEGARDYAFSPSEYPGVKERGSVSFIPQPDPAQKHDRAVGIEIIPPAA